MTTPHDRDRSASELPPRPNLRYLKDRAKAMVRAGEAQTLSLAQFVLAREYGFASWPTLKRHVESMLAGSGSSPTRLLLDAAARGDLAEIKKQHKAGANLKHIYDLDRGYGSFCPPLKPAIEGGHTECVRWLLRHGALDRVWGWDGLRDAHQRGFDAIAALLESHRASEAALLAAIRDGAHGQVRELLEQDPTLAQANEAGHRPGLPPIVVAAELGDLRMVRLLLDAGADPAARHDASSMNALTHARYHGHAEVVELLESLGVVSEGVTDYLFAVSRGDVERVRAFLDAGVDVNAKDDCEHHALIHALRTGDEALMRLLVERGISARHANGWGGYVLLTEFIESGDLATVRRVLDLGYDVNHADDRGNTALSIARRSGQTKIEALLESRGATR